MRSATVVAGARGLTSFTDEMAALGLAVGSRMLAQAIVPASPRVYKLLADKGASWKNVADASGKIRKDWKLDGSAGDYLVKDGKVMYYIPPPVPPDPKMQPPIGIVVDGRGVIYAASDDQHDIKKYVKN